MKTTKLFSNANFLQLYITKIYFVCIPTLPQEQDVTQGQFLRGLDIYQPHYTSRM